MSLLSAPRFFGWDDSEREAEFHRARAARMPAYVPETQGADWGQMAQDVGLSMAGGGLGLLGVLAGPYAPIAMPLLSFLGSQAAPAAGRYLLGQDDPLGVTSIGSARDALDSELPWPARASAAASTAADVLPALRSARLAQQQIVFRDRNMQRAASEMNRVLSEVSRGVDDFDVNEYLWLEPMTKTRAARTMGEEAAQELRRAQQLKMIDMETQLARKLRLRPITIGELDEQERALFGRARGRPSEVVIPPRAQAHIALRRAFGGELDDQMLPETVLRVLRGAVDTGPTSKIRRRPEVFGQFNPRSPKNFSYGRTSEGIRGQPPVKRQVVLDPEGYTDPLDVVTVFR